MPGLAGQKSAFISLVRDGICWSFGDAGAGRAEKCFYFLGSRRYFLRSR